MSDPTARFSQLVQLTERDIPLDEACFLIAAHAHADLDVAAACTRLDHLAGSVDAPDAGALAHALFVEQGFAGNTVDYGDPRNSYLDAVVERRLGIPITLSVLMMEVGRRLGIELRGVGMPGHFLVAGDPGVWHDPFHGGRRLDEQGCRELFAAIHDAAADFRPGLLAPVGTLAILDRILTNLQRTLVEREPGRAAWPTRLRLRLPHVQPRRRAELAALLGSLGAFEEAAAELAAAARELPSEHADRVVRAATHFRARAN